jgi:roadblock/LC7 domain-containing protein
MTPIVASGIFSVAGKLVDRLFPDKMAQDEAKLKLVEMQLNGELAELAANTELAKAQMEVNKVEAASDHLFVAGWRPSVGWISAAALAYQFIAQPLLAWWSLTRDIPVPPGLDLGELMFLLTGMLGLGGYRTFEKLKGVNGKHV